MKYKKMYKGKGIYLKRIVLLVLSVLITACSISESPVKEDDKIDTDLKIEQSIQKEDYNELVQEETNEISEKESKRDDPFVADTEQQEEHDESSDRVLIYDENDYKSLFWKQEYLFDQNKELEADLNNDGKLDLIVVGMDSPNGEKVLLIHKDNGINLIYYISSDMLASIENLYDEFELKEGNMMQVVLVDFDGDSQEEIVLAIGDGLTTLGISIFKINYDNDILDAEEIAFFKGQEKIYIDKNNDIIIPFGSQGLYEQYKYEEGEFLKVKL